MLNRNRLVTVLLPFFVLGLTLILAGPAAAQTGKVNVNIATPDQLSKVPGMTPELAQNIVAYKAKNGSLTKTEDLLKVPGMTPEIFKKLSPSLDKDGNVLVGVAKKAADDEEEEAVLPRY
jgi:competence ComEA-like helix-hairpin-helix protein